MKIIDYIATGIFLISALILVIIVLRKYRALRSIDVAAIHEDHAERLKGDIIANRLSRKLKHGWKSAVTFSAPARVYAKKTFANLRERIEALERDYRVQSAQRRSQHEPKAVARMNTLMRDAEQLFKEGELEKAEQKFIEIISIYPHSAPGFQGLGEVYLEQKDYAHAEESFQHALKLAPDTARAHQDLADVFRLTGQTTKALEAYKQAVALEPNDPKHLDALLSLAITAGDQALAATTLQQLESANPENQKLDDLREQVAQIPKR